MSSGGNYYQEHAIFVRIKVETGLYSDETHTKHSPMHSPCHSFLRLAMMHAQGNDFDWIGWTYLPEKVPTYDFFVTLADIIVIHTSLDTSPADC